MSGLGHDDKLGARNTIAKQLTLRHWSALVILPNKNQRRLTNIAKFTGQIYLLARHEIEVAYARIGLDLFHPAFLDNAHGCGWPTAILGKRLSSTSLHDFFPDVRSFVGNVKLRRRTGKNQTRDH